MTNPPKPPRAALFILAREPDDDEVSLVRSYLAKQFSVHSDWPSYPRPKTLVMGEERTREITTRTVLESDILVVMPFEGRDGFATKQDVLAMLETALADTRDKRVFFVGNDAQIRVDPFLHAVTHVPDSVELLKQLTRPQ